MFQLCRSVKVGHVQNPILCYFLLLHKKKKKERESNRDTQPLSFEISIFTSCVCVFLVTQNTKKVRDTYDMI